MTSSSRIVVTGASTAAGALVGQLRADGYDGDVVVIDPDPEAPYDRPPLSKDFLRDAGEAAGHLAAPAAPWWDDRCDLLRGKAVGLDVDASGIQVALPDGSTVDVDGDHVVIATGCVSAVIPGLPDGVLHLRSVGDARRLRDVAVPGCRVVVLGAGTIGTELASTMRQRGCSVDVVDVADRPLQRLLGGHLGDEARGWIEEAGVGLHLSTRVEGVQRRGHEWLVETSAGLLVADAVVSAVGARPATRWLEGSGVDITDGVRCDENGTAFSDHSASLGHIHAIGDVSSWTHRDGRNRRLENWTAAGRQGRHLAQHLLNLDVESFDVEPAYFWTQQFGRRIQVLGTPHPQAAIQQTAGNAERKAAFFTLTRDSIEEAWIAVNSPREFAMAMRGLQIHAS